MNATLLAHLRTSIVILVLIVIVGIILDNPSSFKIISYIFLAAGIGGTIASIYAFLYYEFFKP